MLDKILNVGKDDRYILNVMNYITILISYNLNLYIRNIIFLGLAIKLNKKIILL